MPCNSADLAEVELFKLLDDEDLEMLAGVVDSQELAANEILFHTGEPGNSLFVVKTGEVELYVKDTAGQKIVLTNAGETSMFGELSMLDNKPRSATAMALIDTELLVVEREDLLFLFQKNPETALNMMAAMSEMLRKADQLLITRVSRNVNEEMEEKISPLEKFSDWIAWFSGSMKFLLFNLLLFFAWIIVNINVLGISPFDPFPFGFLTMITSLESIFLACFVLISQNRQGEKDRVRSDIEYDVNIKAELEVAHLHEKADRIYEQMLERFSQLEKYLNKNND